MTDIGLRGFPARNAFPAASDVLLDWNESPIGPSDLAVQRVVRAAPFLHRYPRGVMEEVGELTASYLGVSPDEVLLTAGVDEATDLTLRLARRAWVIHPGFDGYTERAGAAGKPVNVISLGPDWAPAGQPDPAIGHGDIVFLAQPNNPTGNVFGEQWLAGLRRAASFVFLDETYVDFSSRPSALAGPRREPGLLVFRSFSKAFGLAGTRLGCLVASADTLAGLRRGQRFLPIDSISLHAVAGTLQDTAHIERLTSYVRQARPALVQLLRSCGLFGDVRDTEANFVLACPRPDAVSAVESALLGERIKVRPCDSLGLPGWLRISVGSRDDLSRLGACLSRIGTSTTCLPVLPAG
jgi:histidinol-phosphate aminotransferase